MTALEKINYDINTILCDYEKQKYVTPRERNKTIKQLDRLHAIRNYLETSPTQEFITAQLKQTNELINKIDVSFNPGLAGVYPMSATLKQKKDMYHRKTNYKQLIEQKETLTELTEYISKYNLKLI